MEIEPQEDCTKKLYEASIRGCVTTLNTLLQRDQLILDRISLTPFKETPLHVSCLLGHFDFTKALLQHKPKLATQLDSQGQSPLHLASAAGCTEIVKTLLSVNADVCLVPDQYGRIPLHLAAIRGRIEVIQLLVNACPASIQVKLKDQETVLHLCVKYNHLEALKLLVRIANGNGEFLNSADKEGSTILQLALEMKQAETIKFLLSVPEVRVEAEAFAAAFRNHSLDTKNAAIQDYRADPASTTRPIYENAKNTPHHQVLFCNEEKTAESKGSDFVRYLEYQRKRIEKARGHLMVVATVIASMAFQASINPPGGVWQQEQACPGGKTCKVGKSQLAYLDQFAYHCFIVSNTICFSASLGIIFLLICGFPLKNRFSMGILLITMCTTLLFMAATYITSVILVGMPDDNTIMLIAAIYLMFWVGLLVFIIAYHAVKILLWLLKKLFFGLFLCRDPVTEPPANHV